MTWVKEIITRQCEWDGVEGDHFDTVRFIECIFYGNRVPDENEKPVFSYGAYGAVVGGTGVRNSDDRLMLFGINHTLKAGQAKVTSQEIDNAVAEFRKEIQANPNLYVRVEYL